MTGAGPSSTGGDGTGTPPTRRGALLRLAALVLVVVLAVVAALLVDLPPLAELRDRVAGYGWAAPAVFVGLYAASSLAPLPKAVLSALGGLVFGLAAGTALVYAGAMLGAVATFFLGRGLGRSAVERFTGTRVARVDALLARRGLVTVIALRLVPVVPFTAINYAAGLTAVRTRDYVVGTAVGIAPGTLAYVALGAYGTRPGSWPFLAALAALAVLVVGGGLLARRTRARERRTAAQADPAADSPGTG